MVTTWENAQFLLMLLESTIMSKLATTLPKSVSVLLLSGKTFYVRLKLGLIPREKCQP